MKPKKPWHGNKNSTHSLRNTLIHTQVHTHTQWGQPQSQFLNFSISQNRTHLTGKYLWTAYGSVSKVFTSKTESKVTLWPKTTTIKEYEGPVQSNTAGHTSLSI